MGRVLVVDDETMICDVITEYFRENLGMIVDCANSGDEAADVLERERFDLALIDVTLPGISGFELATLAADEDTPVLLITGNPESNFKLHQFGFPHLAKPFSLERLRLEAARVMAEHGSNVTRVKASVARMEANRAALVVALAESDRLLDTIRRQQQLGRWGKT
jgi:two-component system, OmpR family, alkaline phosphatase synthesis response regulator PhoP